MQKKLLLLFGVYLSRLRALRIQGFHDLEWEKHSIFVFTNLSLKTQISFSGDCRQQTIVVLGAPVTLSPIEIKDAIVL